ncbi:hypothetical protein Pmani_013321 [Petrolisthes manimaculis]|uniref:Uncharacterized protein n=1 Tax=Petrolisthes manimaculis TaxID=1843537 RepID=A0AAE1PXQ0_9EUCA|nr:hypothetical protein Pmani_013321 [Petrolisthes manimaculis]
MYAVGGGTREEVDASTGARRENQAQLAPPVACRLSRISICRHLLMFERTTLSIETININYLCVPQFPVLYRDLCQVTSQDQAATPMWRNKISSL